MAKRGKEEVEGVLKRAEGEVSEMRDEVRGVRERNQEVSFFACMLCASVALNWSADKVRSLKHGCATRSAMSSAPEQTPARRRRVDRWPSTNPALRARRGTSNATLSINCARVSKR